MFVTTERWGLGCVCATSSYLDNVPVAIQLLVDSERMGLYVNACCPRLICVCVCLCVVIGCARYYKAICVRLPQEEL